MQVPASSGEGEGGRVSWRAAVGGGAWSGCVNALGTVSGTHQVFTTRPLMQCACHSQHLVLSTVTSPWAAKMISYHILSKCIEKLLCPMKFLNLAFLVGRLSPNPCSAGIRNVKSSRE